MANPNIVNVSTISGKTNAVVANVALTTACANPVSSGKIFKVNAISLANKTTSTTEVTLQFQDYSQSNATFNIAKTIDVPSESTIFAIDKNTAIYLEEGDAIVCSAVSGSSIDVIVSFEEIS